MSTTPVLDCEQVLRSIFAYLDGELEGGQRRGVTNHLEQCRSCFSRAEFEMRLKGHLAGLGRETPPPAFEERIRSLISQFECD
jgi:mycothiol system anti-sigma-R factor